MRASPCGIGVIATTSCGGPAVGVNFEIHPALRTPFVL
jgi:hypothetical protein